MRPVQVDLQAITDILHRYPAQQRYSLAMLQDMQRHFNYIPREGMEALADYLTVYDETVDDTRDLVIFDPDATWKTKRISNFTAKELQVPIFQGGKLVYDLPKLEDIRSYCAQQVNSLWDEVKRFDNPQTYYVDLSQKLWDIKYGLLRRNGK